MGKTRDPVSVAMGLSFFRASYDEICALQFALEGYHIPAFRLKVLRNFVKESAPRHLMQLAARLRFFGFVPDSEELVFLAEAFAATKDFFGARTLKLVRHTYAQLLATYERLLTQGGAIRNIEHWDAMLGMDVPLHGDVFRAAYAFLCELHSVKFEELDPYHFAASSEPTESDGSLAALLLASQNAAPRELHS